jgi:hypothetical protein
MKNTLESATKITTTKQATRSVNVQHVERTEIIRGVVITLKVPAAIAAVLVKPGYFTRIASAEVGKSQEDSRCQQWHETVAIDGKKHAPHKTLLAEILKQKLDTAIRVYFEADEWQRIVNLCKRLEITTSDWLLSSAFYNARVERERLAKA